MERKSRAEKPVYFLFLFDWMDNAVQKIKSTPYGRALIIFAAPLWFVGGTILCGFVILITFGIILPTVVAYEYIRYGKSKTWQNRAGIARQ